jgi:lipopolysaccharide transport system ATP-binding protein
VQHRRLPENAEEAFWALKDITLSIEQGEAVGFIGENGSGKSTLLKIINRVVYPSKGKLTIRGRIGSMIELGSGLHPELTGRENIDLNAAILGMSAQQTKTKFDSIVDFSNIEDFLDTPIKRYSSGMLMRLAFSISVHIEPDILLVDEVLAVGDAGFREKATRKIEEIIEDGCTVIFVSHSMGEVERICKRAIWLDKGTMIADGPISNIAPQYLDVVMNRNVKPV